MYAVIKTGGKQYKVAAGETLRVERLTADVGADVTLDQVLAIGSGADLVTGSPPYFPPGTATEAEHPQAVPARIEVRGSIADYAATAARILAPGGVFAFVFPFDQRARAEEALAASALVLLRRRDVVFKEGEPPRISLFAAARAADLPPNREAWIEPPLIIRAADGQIHREYRMVRLSFGIPPGDVGR